MACSIIPILLVVCAAAVNARDTPVPTFTINLDLPATERWADIAKSYADKMRFLYDEIMAVVPSPVLDMTSVLAAHLFKYIPQPYRDEMLGFAENAKVSIGELILCNLLYDITAYNTSLLEEGCTSIVVEDSTGKIYHGRNLDYAIITSALKELAIIVEFRSHGKTLYTGTTFAGYVGLVTGQKPYRFTVSMDQRNKGAWWLNDLEATKTGTQGIVNFLIRDVLADPNSDFETAVETLSTTPLIAPCYLIVGGTQPGQGVVITRDRTAAVDVMKLDANHGQWYVLETNYDHWDPPPTSDDRRDPAIKALNRIGRNNINAETLYQALSTPPVLNHQTVYTTIMSAAQPDLYVSVLR